MPHVFVFDLARLADHDGHTDGRFALTPPDDLTGDQLADDNHTGDQLADDDTQGVLPWR